ncbi:hypothetical protein CNY89_28095, partial [Amaricoccus sp. HAR-UPW-R2A-40]
PRRGLVLVDPSYEVKTEYAAIAGFTRRLLAKWPEAAVLIWYPLLPAGRHAALAPLAAAPRAGAGRSLLRGEDRIRRDRRFHPPPAGEVA